MKPTDERLVLLRQVVDTLNALEVRATYTAVGDVIGHPARGVGDLLGRIGGRCQRHSWVVTRRNKRPTGYSANQLHPRLFRTKYVIDSAADLLERL